MGMVAEPLKDKTGAAVREGMGAHSNGVVSNSVVGFATAEYEPAHRQGRHPARDARGAQADSSSRARALDAVGPARHAAARGLGRLHADRARGRAARGRGQRHEGRVCAGDVNTNLHSYIAHTIGAMDAKVGPIAAKIAATKGAVDTIAAEAEGDSAGRGHRRPGQAEATTITTMKLLEAHARRGRRRREHAQGDAHGRPGPPRRALGRARPRQRRAPRGDAGRRGACSRHHGHRGRAGDRGAPAGRRPARRAAHVRRGGDEGRGPRQRVGPARARGRRGHQGEVDATTAAVAERNATAQAYKLRRDGFRRAPAIDAADPKTNAARDRANQRATP